jgi:predicted PurR-regulated permease PerM
LYFSSVRLVCAMENTSSPSSPELSQPTRDQPPSPVLRVSGFRVAAWVSMVALLFVVLYFSLLAPLLSGMAMYACATRLTLPFAKSLDTARSRQVTLAVVGAVLVGLLVALGFFGADLIRDNGSEGLAGLLLRIGGIVEGFRQILPHWVTAGWPDSVNAFGAWLGSFLKSHASDVQGVSAKALATIARALLGLVLGGIVAVSQEDRASCLGPFGAELAHQLDRLFTSFRQIFFAQLKISALNTTFTALFVFLILPIFWSPLPFAKTLVLITFLVGLIPVLGNLISNTLITIIALSVSSGAALAALVFLIAIHKVEYFLNARIVGGQIQARAWELLVAMIVMEAIFGFAGVIAAPIYYAYLKDELRSIGWV